MTEKIIRHYLVLIFLANFGFALHGPIYVLFLMQRGLNLLEVGLVNIFFFGALALAQLPTGIFADVFGRKGSYLWSCFLISVGMTVYAFSHSFWWFVLSEIILAFGVAFGSGAFQAWLVDSLNYYGYSKSLNVILSREQQVRALSMVMGGLVGGVVAEWWGMNWSWLAGSLVVMIAWFLTKMWVKEDYFVRPQRIDFWQYYASLRVMLKVSAQYWSNNFAFRFVLLVGFFYFLAAQAPNMQWQPFFSDIVSSKTNLGFLWAGISAAVIIGSSLSNWLVARYKNEAAILAWSQLLVAGGIFLTVTVGMGWLALVFFLAHELMRGIYRPIRDKFLNDNTASSERATVLSLVAMTEGVGAIIGLIISGAIAQNFSIAPAWQLSGFILAMAITCIWLWSARNKYFRK